MEFPELASLRTFLASISSRHTASLTPFYEPRTFGFNHRFDLRKDKISIASTSTCVSSLVAAGKWNGRSNAGEWSARTRELMQSILHAEWTSTGLPAKNVFSTSFVLEAVHSLRPFVTDAEGIPRYRELLEEAESIVSASLKDGYAGIEPYPASAYLTQLASRVLSNKHALANVRDWAMHEVHRQLALLDAHSKTADVYQLAYAVMLAASLGTPGEATPDEALVLQVGLDRVFENQLPDGSWPRSQPLFHYPSAGNAYCYEYEMLTQLLQLPQLEEQLLKHLPKIRDAAFALTRSGYQLPGQGVGWASGHHPQFKGPESWSTASAYHFIHALDRLLAEAIRQALFNYVATPYVPPIASKSDQAQFAADFLDCPLTGQQGVTSLKAAVFEKFVSPIAKQASELQAGRSLSEDTPMSAIFFGPPGTSKTDLSRRIAEYLGWPRLIVDPSHFVRGGFDSIQAEADRLFSMLSAAERVVVLLDEFDEMVRDRSQAAEVLSRFLTTGMLPKLATINKNRRIVFIVATNYIDHFDLAISRRGRFDIIVQVMPPTTGAKLKHWSKVAQRMTDLGLDRTEKSIDEKLGALTFDEFRRLAPRLEAAASGSEFKDLLSQAYDACTLSGKTGGEQDEKPEKPMTWQKISEKQQKRIRYD